MPQDNASSETGKVIVLSNECHIQRAALIAAHQGFAI